MPSFKPSDIRTTLWPARLVKVRSTLNRSSRVIVLLGLVSLAGNALWVWKDPYAQSGHFTVDDLPLSSWLHPAYINSLIIAIIMLYALRQVSRTREKLTPLGYPLLAKVEHFRGRDVWRSVEPLTKRPAHLHVVHSEKYPHERDHWKEVSHEWVKRGDRVKKLGSPHIARLLDCGFAQHDQFYAVVELPKGMTLYDFVHTHGICPPDRTIFLLAQIAHAIHDAHATRLFNLSLRPQHIWIGYRSTNADWVTVELFGYEEDSMAGNQTSIDYRDFAMLAVGLLTGKWVVEDRANEKSITEAVKAMNQSGIPYMFKEQLSLYLDLTANSNLPPPGELVRRLWSYLPGPTWNNDRAQTWWKEHETEDKGVS